MSPTPPVGITVSVGAAVNRRRRSSHGRLLARVGGVVTERVVEVVDPDVVIQHVDVQALLARIDFNEILDSVDVDRLLVRVDVDRLLDRVDVDRLLERVDIDRLLSRADVESLVRRSGIPDVVAQTTRGLASSVLAETRRQANDLDARVGQYVDRRLRRRTDAKPGVLDGRYAGPIARSLAVLVDGVLVASVFAAGTALLASLSRMFLGVDLLHATAPWVISATVIGWTFLYTFICLSAAGRTPGKSLLGLRVVTRDGASLKARHALVRTATFPLSLLICGLGVVSIGLTRRRRALHDLCAATVVVVESCDPLPPPDTHELDEREPPPWESAAAIATSISKT